MSRASRLLGLSLPVPATGPSPTRANGASLRINGSADLAPAVLGDTSLRKRGPPWPVREGECPIMGFHCTDCVFSEFTLSEKTGAYQGSCSRGYTLTDPHVYESPADHFADDPVKLVPTVDPFGKEYLRKSNVCERFVSPKDLPNAR